MSMAKNVLTMLESAGMDKEAIKAAFTAKLSEYGIDATVEDADTDASGDTVITFAQDDNEMSVVFVNDPVEGPSVLLDPNPDDETPADDSDVVTVDLNSIQPLMVKNELATYVNLEDLSWMNKSTMNSIFTGGNATASDETDEGYIFVTDEDCIDEVAFSNKVVGARKARKVIKGGKVVKIAAVKRHRKHRLTPRQKIALMKARKKSRNPAAMRKRAKALLLRKRLNLDNQPGMK